MDPKFLLNLYYARKHIHGGRPEEKPHVEKVEKVAPPPKETKPVAKPAEKKPVEKKVEKKEVAKKQ